MLNRQILVIDNEWSTITVSSINAMPGWTCKVVRQDPRGTIATALANAEHTSLCVRGGVVLAFADEYLPSARRLDDFDICLSRRAVYIDNESHKGIYELAGSTITPNTYDLDVFFINPERWADIPVSDAGALRDRKILNMPRYMNHRVDRVAEATITAAELARYGVLGHQSCVLNYVDVFERGVKGPAKYAYALDRVAPHLGHLPPELLQQVETVLAACSTQSKFINQLASTN